MPASSCESQEAALSGSGLRCPSPCDPQALSPNAPHVPTLLGTHQSMMLVDSAAENPRTLKLISVAVHSARPPMMGMRDRLTHSPGRDTPGAGL